MKLNKYSWLAALPMIFTACQNDTLVENQQQDKIYTLSAKMNDGAAMSRAQIQLGNTDANAGEIFFWNEGDKITLYQEANGNHSEHVYTISNYSEDGDGDKKVASFVTDNPAAASSVTAFYPSGLATDFDDESKRVSLSLQTSVDFSKGTVEEVWKDYFRNNMLMRATTTLSVDGENTLNFEHLLSLARITYHNESGIDQQVTEIKLGGEQTYGYAPTVWLDYGWVGGMFNNGYGITYNNLTVKAGESFDFYILFGPDDFKEGDMHIHIHTTQTDGNRSPLALPTSTIAAANNGAKGFEAGKRYWFKMTEKPEGLIWTNRIPDAPQGGTIEEVAKNGGTFTITENTRLTTPLVVESDMTLRIEGGWLGGTSGDEFSDPDNLKTLIAVKPGATLTLEGNEQFNTGQVLDQLSCIRMLGGSDAASKVIINDGQIIGTYYAILIDKDCQNGEVEINGGSLSCDWDKNFNGSAILNKSNAKVNIKGGHIASCGSAVEMWGGQFTMSGGTLQSTFEGEKSHVNTNGVAENCIVGSALAIYPPGNQKVTVAISNGTFEGLSSIYEICSSNTPNVSLSVTGGTFEGGINSYNCTGFISGGKFKVQPNTNYLAFGKTAVLNGNYYEIQDGESIGDLVTIQNTELSTALQAVLGAENVKLENGYAVMTKEFAESVTELNIKSNIYTIHSMVGIEYFTNLQTLNCQFSGVEKCDLSKNTKLTNLMMGGNNLTSLDCSNNTELAGLMLENNENLEKLDISGCSKLNTLILTNTKLSEIEVPNPGIIRQLNISRTSLKLSLNAFTDLSNLSCYSCGLTSIDLPTEAKQKLTTLICYSNNIKSLILSEYPNLSKLNCKENLIEELDITSLKNLKELRCGSQNNGIVLKLQMTASQKELWNSTWSTYAENQMNVDISSGSTSEPNTNGNNFWFEEL